VGYRGTNDVALRHVNLFNRAHYVEVPVGSKALPKAVTARDAIGDLPRITEHLSGEARKAPQRLNKPTKLPDLRELSGYARLMRNWPGFESDGYVYDHAIRFLPRDYKLFKAMRSGDQYPEAHALAAKMFRRALAREEAKRGSPLPMNSKHYRELHAFYVPPYDPGKFPNKWRKMEADEPSRTLMAHIGKDTYSHIHYDSAQARTISVREAARLQSFPDGFRFSGTMNPAFRQIGNAVPPLLAYAVAARLLADLTDQKYILAADLFVRYLKSVEIQRESVSSCR
jgi:DNA (cytosine-5)-methyltransferase 1